MNTTSSFPAKLSRGSGHELDSIGEGAAIGARQPQQVQSLHPLSQVVQAGAGAESEGEPFQWCYKNWPNQKFVE